MNNEKLRIIKIIKYEFSLRKSKSDSVGLMNY